MINVKRVPSASAILFALFTIAISAGSANAEICPAVGADTDCGIVITITDNGSSIIFTGQGPYDGIDDTLVGIINNSSRPIGSLGLSSLFSIFDFDGDGIVTYGIPGNTLDNTTYGGPNAYFTNINSGLNSGTVKFITPLAATLLANLAYQEVQQLTLPLAISHLNLKAATKALLPIWLA